MTAVELAHGLYSPAAHRLHLMGASAEVADALRAGNVDDVVTLFAEREALSELDVLDTVIGQRELYKVPWSSAPDVPGRRDVMLLTRTGGRPKSGRHLSAELKLRGATPSWTNYRDVKFLPNGTMTVAGVPRALPEAVMPVAMSPGAAGLLDEFEAAGVHVVNGRRAVLTGRDKGVMAKVLPPAGVPMPLTVTDITTRQALEAAGDIVGWPAVLKYPRSAVSRHVEKVHDLDEATRVAHEWGMGPRREMLLQRLADLGNADVRLHMARDVVTGELRPVAAYHRVAATAGEFRANGGVDGNLMRPIHDLSGADPDLDPEMLAMAVRAGDAGGFDWHSIDIARDQATGRPVVIEVDNFSNPIEQAAPVPVEQLSFGRAADLLVWGRRAHGS